MQKDSIKTIFVPFQTTVLRIMGHVTLQIHTVERQWKCSETTVLLEKYSGLPQTMLHCIFYQ